MWKKQFRASETLGHGTLSGTTNGSRFCVCVCVCVCVCKCTLYYHYPVHMYTQYMHMHMYIRNLIHSCTYINTLLPRVQGRVSYSTIVPETAVVRGHDLLPLPLVGTVAIPLVVKGHDLVQGTITGVVHTPSIFIMYSCCYSNYFTAYSFRECVVPEYGGFSRWLLSNVNDHHHR